MARLLSDHQIMGLVNLFTHEGWVGLEDGNIVMHHRKLPFALMTRKGKNVPHLVNYFVGCNWEICCGEDGDNNNPGEPYGDIEQAEADVVKAILLL